jgi:hypothetical protein
VSLPDGGYPRHRLCDQVCHCHEMSEARRKETAASISEKKRAQVAAQIEQQAKRERGKRLTVEEFGELWTSGKL